MKRFSSALALIVFCAALAYGATGASISGVVRNATGAPFRGAFVHAQNVQTKISVHVLSDSEGRYRIPNLPPGEYQVRVTATGYKAAPRNSVKLAAGDSASLDFGLQPGAVRWADLSVYQGKALMPAGKGKDLLTGNCFACHGFQTRMAAVVRDHDGWTQAVNYMLTTRHARLGNHFNDEDAAVLATYLDDVFGVEAKVPKSAADLPGYKATLRPVSDEGLKITYVEYDMPGPNRMPFSAAPDKDGKLWIPDMGSVNTIGRLDPNTERSRNLRRRILFPLAFTRPFPRRTVRCGFPSRPRTKWAAGIRKRKKSPNIRTRTKRASKATRTAARNTPCASIPEGAYGARPCSPI